jgi:hypothetical protein
MSLKIKRAILAAVAAVGLAAGSMGAAAVGTMFHHGSPTGITADGDMFHHG